MGIGTLQAKRYARAIFEIAREQGSFTKWQDDLDRLLVLTESKEIVSFIESPRFSLAQKVGLFSSQFQSLDLLASNLLRLLIHRNCLRLLPDIVSVYRDLLNEHLGIQKAMVTTAIHLEESEKQKIRTNLESLTGKKVELTFQINPAVIGGIIVEIGNKLIDGSTDHSLHALKNELIGIKQ